MIPYTYEIISVDEQARAMEVVYSSEGRQTMHIGARLPYVGESLESIIQMYSPVAYWMEQDAQVVVPELGSGEIVPPAPEPVTLESAKRDKLAELAAWRYAKEVGGINVAGAKVKTDRESQATLTGAFISLSQGLLQSVDWKLDNGQWATLTLAEITPIAQAVVSHVQACFTAEKLMAAEINALPTIEAVQSYTFPEFVA